MSGRAGLKQADPRERLRRELERAAGRPVALRAMQPPDPRLRGRLTAQRGYLLVEYRDRTGGYFWDLDVLRELLAQVRAGARNLTLYDSIQCPGPGGEHPSLGGRSKSG